MGRTITYTEELITEICWCGLNHAIPKVLSDKAHRDGTAVWCPLGHEWVITKTREKQLEEEPARKTAALDQARARSHDLEASNSNLRGQVTKAKNERDRLKKRAAAGVDAGDCHRLLFVAWLEERHEQYWWAEVQYADDEGDDRILRTDRGPLVG